MRGIADEAQRIEALELFKAMYAPAIGTGLVQDYLARTGLDVIKGAQVLKEATHGYESRRRIRQRPDRPEPAGRGQGASGRGRDAHLLHTARWL